MITRATIILCSALVISYMPTFGAPVAAAPFSTTATCSNTTALRAVPTFESLGLYLDVGAGEAQVRYRAQGQTAWKEGLSLWYDSRTYSEIVNFNNGARHRGSLANLTTNTTYEVQVLHGTQLYCGTFRTLNDTFPVARTVQIGNRTTPLTITQGGTANGYVVYEGGSISLAATANQAITVSADFVIIRNTTIQGSKLGIVIGNGHHDVVIENNVITNWGELETDAGSQGPTSQFWGDSDEAIVIPENAYRITIQRNHIHTPRTDSNTWQEMRDVQYNCIRDGDTRCHPWGPRAIMMRSSNQGIQRIIRYNTFAGTRTNMMEDPIVGDTNDSDIYGNFFTGFADDSLEVDGVARNTRIWGNRIHVIAPDGYGAARSFAQPGIFSSSPVEVGPVYIWRNLTTGDQHTSVNQALKKQSRTDRGPADIKRGRLYFFHNTFFDGNISGTQQSFPLANVIAYNNLVPGGVAYLSQAVSSEFGNNLFTTSALSQLDTNFIVRTGTAGFNAGRLLSNFNDTYAGTAPDIGYQEAGGTPLRVGHTGTPLIVTGGGSGAVSTPLTPTTPLVLPATICGEIVANNTPTGYGSAYNHFTTNRELIVQANCQRDDTYTPIIGSVNTDTSNFAVFNTGYYWNGVSWESYTLNPITQVGSRRATSNTSWILGPARGTEIPYIPGTLSYFVAFTCNIEANNALKCGCANPTCSQARWQLQAVRDPN
jgi:hypothetical protein